MSTTPTTILPESRTERYCCNQCNETFERTYPRPESSICTINHAKGCCHYGDTIVTKRQLRKEAELQ
jgi:hypothetical protein